MYIANRNDLKAKLEFYRLRNQVRDLSFIGLIVYGVFMECTPLQATFGKALCGLKVVDAQGQRLTFARSLSRNWSKLLSYLSLSVGFIWALFNPRRQTWHDMIAGTYVVRRRPPRMPEQFPLPEPVEL